MNNKKLMRWIFPAAFVMALAGCDGISGTGGPSRGADDSHTQEQTPANGQAVLGPVVGATVTVRDIEDINNVACTATTTDNDDLAKAGNISFDTPCIYDDHLYVVNITGGSDVDFNDDNVRDATPTVNTGEFRALLSGEQLLQNNWKVNALTEAVYQAMQYALQTGADNITATVDQLAQQLLTQDINNDGVINRFDIAQWHPVNNAAAVADPEKLRLSAQLIHQNLNRTLTNISDADAVVGRIDTLAPARQVLTYHDLLLVTTDTALLIYRVQGTNSTLLSSLALGWVYDMTLAGDALYVALGDSGIARIDLSDASQPIVSERWPYHAQRIASLGENVVFTVATKNAPQLMMIDANSAQQVVLQAQDEPDHSDPQYDSTGHEILRPPLLKTVGDVVYWAPFSSVRRLKLQDGRWDEIDALEIDAGLQSRIVEDVEVVGNTAYVVAETTFFGGKFVWWVTDNEVFIHNLSDGHDARPAQTINAPDFIALRYINSELIGVGHNTLSLRTPATLEATASLLLPESFSDFDTVHGITSSGDLLAVAAKENGVLFFSTATMPAPRYIGKAMLRGPVAGARVSVRNIADNTEVCATTTTNEGAIAIPKDCIAANNFYDVQISGGKHLYNGEEFAFQGQLHALMEQQTFVQADWIVGYISTLVFDTMQPTLHQTSSPNDIGFGLRDISWWWLKSITASYGELLHGTSDPETVAITKDLQRDNDSFAQLQNGNWNGNAALLSLTGVSEFLEHGAGRGATANSHGLFVAVPDGFDIYANSPQLQKIGHIAETYKDFRIDDSTLAIDDRTNGEFRLYDITNTSNAVLRQTFAYPQVETSGYDRYCVTTSHFFLLANELHSYRFSATGLQEIRDLNNPGGMFFTNMGCSGNQVFFSSSSTNQINIATINNSAVTWQTLSLTGLDVNTWAISGNILVIEQLDGTLQRFTRQADGNFQHTAQSAPGEEVVGPTTDCATMQIAGNQLLISSCGLIHYYFGPFFPIAGLRLQIVDLQSLKLVRQVSLPFMLELAANEEFAWAMGMGMGMGMDILGSDTMGLGTFATIPLQ